MMQQNKGHRHWLLHLVILAMAGILLALTLPGWGWVTTWPLALSLAFHACHGRTGWSFFWSQYGWQWWFHLIGLLWIVEPLWIAREDFAWAIPIALLGLPCVAAFPGALMMQGTLMLPGALSLRNFSWLWQSLAWATAWTASEWLRGWLGFPWNWLGTVWNDQLEIAIYAREFGVLGLSWLTFWVGVLPGVSWCAWRESGKSSWYLGRHWLIGWLAVCLGCLAFGWMGAERLRGMPTEWTDQGVRMVQIGAKAVWRPSAEHTDEELRRHQALSRLPWQLDTSLDWLIWPESGWPDAVQRTDRLPVSLPSDAGSLQGWMVGSMRWDAPNDWYNSVLWMDAEGLVQRWFDKRALVPFGEFVPLGDWPGIASLSRGLGSFRRGEVPRYFEDAKAVPLICYEAVFPELTAGVRRLGARWLLNVTNDGWFGGRLGPIQHLASVRFRAIEQGLPLIRVARSGISAIVDPYGRITHRLPYGVEGVIDARLPAPSLEVPWSADHGAAIWGWVAWLWTGLALASVIGLSWGKQPSHSFQSWPLGGVNAAMSDAPIAESDRETDRGWVTQASRMSALPSSATKGKEQGNFQASST